MEPGTFSKLISSAAADLLSELYYFSDLPRSRVLEIFGLFENFLKHSGINLLFEQILKRLQVLGESKDHLIAYHYMLQKIQNPFQDFRTERQCLIYLENSGSYIPPEEVTLLKDNVEESKEGSADNYSTVQDNRISIQLIPVRHVLKKFFQIPGVYDITMSHLNQLEEQQNVLTNVVQGEAWKEKKKSFNGRVVLPLLLYQDDFETNNPLGSHKGVGKVGGVYIVIPCLPPHLLSKIENIFVLFLYKSSDQIFVTLDRIYAKALQELYYLETEGITVSTAYGEHKVYFSIAAAIGDNLAIHNLFGFMKGFLANHPCRFCLIHHSDINSTFSETSCTLRTHSNYLEHVARKDPSNTGVPGIPALYNLRSAATMDIMTVDPMHDVVEGFWQHDIGQILHQFIVIDQLFTCDYLNTRVKNFDYGYDEGRNKPRPISLAQIKSKFIKMSASESLCFSRNISLLIGDLIPRENEHWKLIILLTEIINIIMAPAVTEGLSQY